MPFTIQGPCQSRKTAENCTINGSLADFATQELGQFAKRRSGTFARPGASNRKRFSARSSLMLGKLAGAWLGDKIAGPHQGAKGAIIGYGAASLARRSVPTLAAVALGGWAFRKWRDRRRARASYPSEASPSSPSA
jgi:hypothetical protein